MEKLLFLASNVTLSAHAIAKHIRHVSRKRTAFISTAAEGEDGPKKWLSDDRGALETAGFSLLDYSITGKTPRQLRKDLRSCDIIHVNGGSTFYLLLQAQRSGFVKFIKEFVANGGIYIGSSAGSIIAGPDISVSRRLESKPFLRRLANTKGFGLVNVVVLPHWGQKACEKFYLTQRMRPAYQSEEKIILLRDNQYLKVCEDGFKFLDG